MSIISTKFFYGNLKLLRIARIQIWVDNQGRWERAQRGNTILNRCVFSLERNISKEDDELIGFVLNKTLYKHCLLNLFRLLGVLLNVSNLKLYTSYSMSNSKIKQTKLWNNSNHDIIWATCRKAMAKSCFSKVEMDEQDVRKWNSKWFKTLKLQQDAGFEGLSEVSTQHYNRLTS